MPAGAQHLGREDEGIVKFTLERSGSELVYDCEPRAGDRPGAQATMVVRHWQCRIGTPRSCKSDRIVGRNMREAGPDAREARAHCAACGEPVGTLRIEGLPRGTLPVGA